MSEVKFDRVDPVTNNPFYDPDCECPSIFDTYYNLSCSRELMDYWDSRVMYNKKNMTPEAFEQWFEYGIYNAPV